MSAPPSPVLTDRSIEAMEQEEVHELLNDTSCTMTVAMIKHHALDHRFDIERRISEEGFEVRGISRVLAPSTATEHGL